jgi:membrane protein implicated in regulation of membrane protease activity
MFKRLAIILLFALIASPMLFKAVAGLLGSWVASTNSGSPTPAGLLLHGLVFLLLSTMVLRSVREGIRNYAEPSEAYAEGYAEAVEEKYAEEMYAEEPYEEYR